jgi:hypothetical protein
MKKHLLFTLAIFFLSLNSSQGQFVNYENDYGWNLGFNIGGVWQQNDFGYTPKGGISGGLTFGKSIYEKEGAFFAFDLRYRYLGGWNKGNISGYCFIVRLPKLQTNPERAHS